MSFNSIQSVVVHDLSAYARVSIFHMETGLQSCPKHHNIVPAVQTKGKVYFILPVTKDRLPSLLETQNDINFGHVKTCVKP